MKIRTYTELIKFPTFEERFRYLKLNGAVGRDTFGWDRYVNQKFYRSQEWKRLRNELIARDCGRDLASIGYEISGQILIHHMNPITVDDISEATDYLMDPEYLICTTHETHNAIHYGREDSLHIFTGLTERKPGDTCLWSRH